MIRQLSYVFTSQEMIFRTATTTEILPLLSSIPDCSSEQDDAKTCSLESNRIFSVQYFYKFLMDGGIRISHYPLFWKTEWSSKITLFCWLVCEDKILTLTNLAKKGCNFQSATGICVLCLKGSQIAEHLFLRCEFSQRI